jgi:hypothetical protein
MVRIIIGCILIIFFIGGVVGSYLDNWRDIGAFVGGGLIIYVLPGVAFIYFGYRARKRTRAVSIPPTQRTAGEPIVAETNQPKHKPYKNTMPEHVEFAFVPTQARCCIIFAKRLPEAVQNQFKSGIWNWAKKEDPKLNELLPGTSATPVKFDIQLVSSSDVDFKTASLAAVRCWMNDVLPSVADRYYRMFPFPSHSVIEGERYDWLLMILLFGNQRR